MRCTGCKTDTKNSYKPVQIPCFTPVNVANPWWHLQGLVMVNHIQILPSPERRDPSRCGWTWNGTAAKGLAGRLSFRRLSSCFSSSSHGGYRRGERENWYTEMDTDVGTSISGDLFFFYRKVTRRWCGRHNQTTTV
jgi:hypothetical protein